ncbi:hypothetical protein Elgi_74800 [Paenibacillus elgii]|uniref:hypothetical protein n=1 Tax=Paenibacillus elgii TaxID=189691 RepID=UPI002D7C337D|nr:hypothetical protein Elgi_74800 [Paenibacillus elgii]
MKPEWMLVPGKSDQRVYVQLKDAAGNISAPIVDTILYKSLPSSAGHTVVGYEDQPLRFSVTDFVYRNDDGSPLQQIKFIIVPNAAQKRAACVLTACWFSRSK